jgi:CHAT domain-containing protein/tetratricopeptide (TPR) repeat protein
MKRTTRTVVVACAVLVVRSSNSQKTVTTGSSLIDEYRAALVYYNKATALSSGSHYSEQEEEDLNRRSLNSFKVLLPEFPSGAAYDSLRFRTCFYIGELEHYFNNLPAAFNYYKEAIIIKERSSLADSFLFKPYIFAGIILYNQNKYDSAALFFHNAEAVQAKYKAPLQDNERLYNTLGVLNYETGNYVQAKNYFLKAKDELPHSNPYYRNLLVNYNINLAQIHFKLEEYDEANKIYQSLLPLKINLDQIYHNLGLINLKSGAPEKALAWFKKLSASNSEVTKLYNNIGNAYLLLKNYDSARTWFAKAITAFEKDKDHTGLGLTYKNLGDLECALDSPLFALPWYNAAMHQFYPSYGDTTLLASPKKFTGVFSYIQLFTVLRAKAEALDQLYKNKKELSWAERELETYQSAFALIDYVERTYNSDEARLFINRIKYEVHTKPIDIAFELYKKTGKKYFLDALYTIDQQNKASVLALNQQESEQATNPKVNKEERNLKTAITRLSLQAASITDETRLRDINNSIRDNEIHLAKLQNELSSPAISARDIPDVNALQNKLLDRSTALVSYHLSENNLTTLIITKKDFNCTQQPLPGGFREMLKTYITALRNRTDAIRENKILYNLLFGSIEGKNINRMVIIPDDELNYLPFESLKNNEGDYVAETYSIQYQYSTAILKKQETGFKGHRSLSFAPFATTTLNDSTVALDPLPHSLEEIRQLKGKKFLNAAATKTAFLDHVSEYNVVHLATHAIAAPGAHHSFIAFYGDSNKISERLYTEEIYDLSLSHTKLVILSACETGAGDLVKGEGVMSLSRAFTYAGCPNIITSLWKANDFSTSYITRKIHFYLDKGLTTDEAVQQAKLDYLHDDRINPRMKHPYYWSNLVFIGNYQPVNKSYLHWYIIAAFILFAAAVFLYLLRKKRVRI